MFRPRAIALSSATVAVAALLTGRGPAPASPPTYRGPIPTITVTAIPSESVIGH